MTYVLPRGLTPQRDAEGRANVRVVFYQGDDPSHAARLSLSLVPWAPEVRGEGERVARFDGGIARLHWEGFALEAEVLAQPDSGGFRFASSLSLAQANALLQALESATTIVVSTSLSYQVEEPPVDALARIDLGALHAGLQARYPDRFTGKQLRDALLGEVLVVGPGAAPWQGEVLAATVAPWVAAALADEVDEHPLFVARGFRLRAPTASTLQVDLRRACARQEIWQSEWSLSDFYAEARRAGTSDSYFTKVSFRPAAAFSDVWFQSSVFVDGEAIEKVLLRVRYPQLGKRDTYSESFELTADGPAAVRCRIPRIAFQPLAYEYHWQVVLAAGAASDARLVPREPAWIASSTASVQLADDELPIRFLYVRARPEVFLDVETVTVSLGASPSEVLASVQLTATRPGRWIGVQRAQLAGQLHWQATFGRAGRSVGGAWHASDRVTVLATESSPSLPMLVQLRVLDCDVAEVQGVDCQLEPGDIGTEAPSLERTLRLGASELAPLWPRSIFDVGYSTRFRVRRDGGPSAWTPWSHHTERSYAMDIEDAFYATHTVRATLHATFASRNGPNPEDYGPSLIYAELHLRPALAAEGGGASATFDRDNIGQELVWRRTSRQDAKGYAYTVDVLTVDGRFLSFGPFADARDTLSLQVYATRSSDREPAEFALRVLD